MSILAWIRIGLEVILRVTKFLDNRQLLEAGEDKQIAKTMTAIAQRLGLKGKIVAETASMTDEELNNDLKGDDS